MVKISEPDPGHRHWSAVAWMYPGIFHPIGVGEEKVEGNSPDNITRCHLIIVSYLS